MPLRDDLLDPIAGSNPSGENLRYAPVYDQIKEARREDDNIDQGEWKAERKKADWVLVTKLCSEALARKSKDLQLAAWLTEAALRREGFAGLRGGLDLLRGLLEKFWETLYPEIDDGDLELRATPLDWIGSRLDRPLKSVPLVRAGQDWLKYRESRSVPYEADCSGNEAKTQARSDAISDGKLTPEAFDEAVKDTPKAFYQDAEEQLDGCLESLAALSQTAEEKFGDSSPNLLGLRKSLEEVRQTVHILLAKKRELEPDAEEPEEAGPPLAPEEAALIEQYAPVAAAAAAAAAPARAPAPKPKGPLAPEPVDREDAIARVLAGARYLRQNEPDGPAGYLIPLALRWGELRAGGNAPDPSLFEAPPSETRQELKSLASQGEWQQVLEAAAAAAGQPCGRAWLDPGRFAVRACEELGYPNVAAAIRSEMRALLADIPGLAELGLADDTPTANADTRAWIQEQVNPAQRQPQEDLYAAPAREPELESDALGEETIDAFKLAADAARSGHAQEAVEILTRELAQESSGRARFERKAQLAQICLAAGYESIAYPILDSLAEEIERRKLEEWEAAEMVAHPLVLLFRCMDKMDVPAEVKQKIYHRICRLDPVQALAVAK